MCSCSKLNYTRLCEFMQNNKAWHACESMQFIMQTTSKILHKTISGQQIRNSLTAKFIHEYIIATRTLLWCNLIASLLPHPVCSRGTARLERRLLDNVRACAEISKKLNLHRTFPAKNAPIFLLPDIWPSLQIFAYGMPLHTYVFSVTHNAVVLSESRCVHPENQTKIFRF